MHFATVNKTEMGRHACQHIQGHQLGSIRSALLFAIHFILHRLFELKRTKTASIYRFTTITEKTMLNSLETMYFLHGVTVDQLYGFDLLNKILYLHCTSSEAALEVAFPRLLFATHWYSPLSVLFTSVSVNCFLSAEKLILGLLFVFT